MARTNLHELASRLLISLDNSAPQQTFVGKLREVAAEAGLNSVRTAEAVKLLEHLGRIEVVQRGRRGRDTIIKVRSVEPVTLADAEASMPSRQSKRSPSFTYDEIGRAVVDRLLAVSRDDGLRAAQVEAFASESQQLREQVGQLMQRLEDAQEREDSLRVRLRAAEETLARAEENLRRAMGGGPDNSDRGAEVADDDARALLDVLRTGRA